MRGEIRKVIENDKDSNLGSWCIVHRGEIPNLILDVLNMTVFNQDRTVIWVFKYMGQK